MVLLGVLLGVASLIVVGQWLWPRATTELLVLVPASFFGLGKFLPGAGFDVGIISQKTTGIEVTFSSYQLGLVIACMDFTTGLLMVYGLDAIYRLPLLGRLLDKARDTAQVVLLANSWMRRVATLAVILFVLFPVSGTGAVGAAFMGSVLGMHRYRLLACIGAGGLLGGLGMAFLFRTLGKTVRQFENNPWLIAGMVLGGVLFLWWFGRALRRGLGAKPSAPAKPGTAEGD